MFYEYICAQVFVGIRPTNKSKIVYKSKFDIYYIKKSRLTFTLL